LQQQVLLLLLRGCVMEGWAGSRSQSQLMKADLGTAGHPQLLLLLLLACLLAKLGHI
jgi:hypothetical protein